MNFLELEADAEVERERKERERQQKLHVLTLSETREQIAQSESRLAELKEEKHQLFLQLKKVLNEDEVRKRQLLMQEASEQYIRSFQHFTYQNPNRIHLMPDQGAPHHHPSQNFPQPIQLTRTSSSITQPQAQVFKVGHPPPPQGGSHHTTSPQNAIPLQVWLFNYFEK